MNEKLALRLRQIMDEDSIMNTIHKVGDDDYILFWTMMEGDHLIDHGTIDKSTLIADLPFPQSDHPYYTKNTAEYQQYLNRSRAYIPQDATPEERKGIADANLKKYGGEFEPDWVAVWPHYISDGPGYSGWVAVAVGGEPCYISSYTKDDLGVICLDTDANT